MQCGLVIGEPLLLVDKSLEASVCTHTCVGRRVLLSAEGRWRQGESGVQEWGDVLQSPGTRWQVPAVRTASAS